MKEEQFWAIVEEIGWPCEPNMAKRKLMFRYSAESMEEFHEEHQKRLGELGARITEHEQRVGKDLNSWGDRYSDLINHVVGLSQAEFEACMTDPERIWARCEREDYVESFSYCLPHVEDYELLVETYYRNSAGRLLGQMQAGDALGGYTDKELAKIVSCFSWVRELLTELQEGKFREAVAKAALKSEKGYSIAPVRYLESMGHWKMGYALENLMADLRDFYLGENGSERTIRDEPQDSKTGPEKSDEKSCGPTKENVPAVPAGVPVSVGDFLRMCRENRGLSLRELSVLSGVDHSYINRLEQGRARRPSKQISGQLKRALKMSSGQRRVFNLLRRFGALSSGLVDLALSEEAPDLPMLESLAGLKFAASWPRMNKAEWLKVSERLSEILNGNKIK